MRSEHRSHPHPGRLEPPPLDRSRLAGAPEPWTVEVVAEADSTNALVAGRARGGAGEGLVVVAEHQTAGRGRLDRSWVTRPREALTFSVLLRPRVPDRWWTWLPLLAGVAVRDGVAAAGGADCRLKWPNDLTYAGRKVGGLLAERIETPSGPAAVLGIGINVTTQADRLPVQTATSLALVGEPPERTALLLAVLAALGDRYRDWAEGWVTDRGPVDGAPPTELRAAYTAACETVGQEVRVQVPAGAPLEGVAVGVADDGGLVVATAAGRTTVGAGDVVHVRPVTLGA